MSLSQRNFEALTRYASAGFLCVDNDLSERILRLVVIGRKTGYTAAQTRGHTVAILFFRIASCNQLDIAPFANLRDLLVEFPSISNPKSEQLDHWLPDAWKQRNAKTETRSDEE